MLKRQLRSLFRSKRNQIKDNDLARYSLSIGQQLIGLLSQQSEVHYLHTFLPATGKKEVDTFLILEQIRRALPNLHVLAPRMEPGERKLSHHLLLPDTQVLTNEWGIPEPVGNDWVDVKQIDVVLVPLLAYDLAGNRVGYGGGYYDVFLKECRSDTLKIGLSFFSPADSITDSAPHDVRMNLCITPENTWQFGQQT
jgi:5-formyltetrahydrofolate cyclo-ligase